MPALFLFLFKVNIALVLFCLGYYLVLRHLTFYTLNRIYLVAAILFSSLYPNINLSDFAQHHQQLTQPVQSIIMNWKTPAENFVMPLYQPNYWQWVEVIFWAGVILFAVRLIMQLFSLYKLYRQSKPGEVHNQSVRLIRDDISPFSFWRSIYINPSKLSPSELKSVLEHEQVHVSEWHTLDILLAELSTIFYWFNPGVWLMKKAVRENIEFITDRKILQKGMDSKEYQYSLVSVGLAATSNNIVNHFNMSTIKKRIIMMNTKKSAGYNLTRYVFLVPVVVALLLIFSLSKAEVTKKGMHTFNSIATVVSHAHLLYNGKPHVTDLKLSEKTVVEKAATKNVDTIYNGKAKNGKKSFMVMANVSGDSVNYVINGVKATKAEVKAIDPTRINSIELLTAKNAKQFYPELDNDRQVMFVTTDDSDAGKKLKEKIDKAMGDGMIAGARNISITGSPDMAPPPPPSAAMAYTISSDNKLSDVEEETNGNKNVSTVIVTDVAPKVKGKTLILKKDYHITGKPGSDMVITQDVAPEVITVEGININKATPPDGKPRKVFVRGFNTNNDQLTIDGEGQPLFIIDGKEAKSLKNVSPADIKSISVLKDGAAEKQYGEKGKNGVVVIITKKGK
ncbi:TonB-dependent receptor plug domain-containing protein [Mucilaginibacter sp. McL0603]|uniref:M56 family metallopeptidase n=1 Tax=Mucilaginibacter sp. McL0603 TaxID=3415670 RepID=UPI003CE6DFB9